MAETPGYRRLGLLEVVTFSESTKPFECQEMSGGVEKSSWKRGEKIKAQRGLL